MTIAEGIYAHLAADSSISLVVGDRIYPAKLPQEPVLPAISFTRIGGGGVEEQNAKASLKIARYQFDYWAENFEDADNLRALVRARLESYRGLMGSVQVQACHIIEDGIEDWDDVPNDYRITSEFEIWFV